MTPTENGKLSKEEKAEMKKDKQAGAAKKAGGKKKKTGK